jgi:hypothetical protein
LVCNATVNDVTIPLVEQDIDFLLANTSNGCIVSIILEQNNGIELDMANTSISITLANYHRRSIKMPSLTMML